MKFIGKCYRHGDVLIRYIDELPNGCQRKEGLVVAESEVTGHVHSLTSGELQQDSSGEMYGVFGSTTRIVHGPAAGFQGTRREDHPPMDLPAGTAWIGSQLEYDDEEEWRNVSD